jgi:hypothetical protein
MTEGEKSQIQEAVILAFDGLVAASRSLNSERYLEYFDQANFTGLGEQGMIWRSIDEFAVVIRAGFSQVENVQSLRFKNIKITVVSRTVAILVNEFEDRYLLKSGDVVSGAGGGTQVWHLSSGTWRRISVSASARPRKDVVSRL